MTTEELLAILTERGLRLVRRPDGTPALRGDAAEATPSLRAVLPYHRDALLRLAAPDREAAPPGIPVPGARRSVLLRRDLRPADVTDGDVEAVLEDAAATPGRLRELAADRPGRTLAAQWWDACRGPRWVTHLTITWPPPAGTTPEPAA